MHVIVIILSRSITSLGSALTPQAIADIERNFLSPYYAALAAERKAREEKEKEPVTGVETPLLEDFDSEIAFYVVK